MSKVSLLYTQLLDELKRIAYNYGSWDEFARLLSEGTFDSKVVLQGVVTQPYECFGIHSYGFNKATINNYINYHFHTSPWKNFLIDADEGEVIWTDRLMPMAELRRTAFYNELLKPEGSSESSTGMKIFGVEDNFTTIAIHYEHKISYEAHLVASKLFERIKYDLKGVLSLNKIINSSNTLHDGRVGFSLDNINLPCFIINEACSLIAVNGPFNKLIQEGAFFEASSLNKLHMREAKNQALFEEKLSDLFKQRKSKHNKISETLDLILYRDDKLLQFTFIPITYTNKIMNFNGIPSYLIGGDMFIVTISSSEVSRAADYLSEKLIAKFNLTKTEVKIVNYLIKGYSLNDISKVNKVSIHTVRTQVKSIFSKMPVSRQQDLVAYALNLINNAT